MDQLNRLGFGADVDALESYVATLQDAAGMGNPLVTDAVYDMHVKLLKELKPNSEVLNRNWETEETELNEYDELLKKYGMTSITTISSLDELYKFRELLKSIGKPVDLMCGLKENGHGVRAVYLNGYLYSGSTRGRYKKGRDITRHLKAILPHYVPAWENIKIVELRGEMLVSIYNFENHLKNYLKTPLSSVTSLIRDSVSDSELNLLNFVAYKILTSDDTVLNIATQWDEYKHLESCGFEVPQHARAKDVTASNLNNVVTQIVNHFEGMMDRGEIKYACDGIVVGINDRELFYNCGRNGNTWAGNFAIKMGKYWESNIYSSIIKEVIFVPGKSYMTPKAIINPVVTANGSSVSTVPLYNIGVMERYGYIPGAEIYFRYGGEMGVTTCDSLGDSVSVNG